MNRFRLSITLGNAEMQTADDVAWALGRLITELRAVTLDGETTGTIRDLNGNQVGEWRFE